MANKTRKKWLTRAVAICHDCDWKEEDYNIAQKEARRHAIKTGHMVEVQTSHVQLYNSRYKKLD